MAAILILGSIALFYTLNFSKRDQLITPSDGDSSTLATKSSQHASSQTGQATAQSNEKNPGYSDFELKKFTVTTINRMFNEYGSQPETLNTLLKYLHAEIAKENRRNKSKQTELRAGQLNRRWVAKFSIRHEKEDYPVVLGYDLSYNSDSFF